LTHPQYQLIRPEIANHLLGESSMTENSRSSSKLLIEAYVIYTTAELGEAVYYAKNLEIEGSFVKFTPVACQSRTTTSKISNEEWTLPERLIKKIIYEKIKVPQKQEKKNKNRDQNPEQT
jgi:hypothetical protein